MHCFRTTSDMIKEMVVLMKENGESDSFIQGYLIGSLAVVLAYDCDDKSYDINMKSIEKKISELKSKEIKTNAA